MQKGVASFLLTYGRGWSVSWNDLGLVGQGQQAAVNRVEDLVVVAAGKVGASDAAGKERVSGDEQFERRKVQADGALGVSGGVQDLGRVGGESHSHSVG